MPIDYTSRDFSSVKNDLVRRARVSVPEWTSGGTSDFAMTLIDLWAYVADIQNYYLDRAYSESFIDTATQSSSIHALARMLGYTPNPAVSATTSVYLYNATAAAVTIPKGTMFYVPSTTTADVVYFTSTTEVSVAANTSSGNGQAVAVIEGRAVAETLTTNYFGDPSGTFKLSESGVIPSSLGLTVGTTTYTHTTRLTEAAASSPAFTSITNSVGDTVIVLGNGINGLVPPGGSTIKVEYRVGGGSKGNVAANAITEMNAPLTGITINISNVAVGGTNPETLASIKANAPSVKRTQNRAVTLLDYESLVATFPGVVKSFTTSASPSGTTTVYYSALPYFSDFDTRDSSTAVSLTADFGTAGNEINNDLLTYITKRSMLGVAVQQINTTINFADVYIGFSAVKVRDGYYQSEVTTAISAAIRTMFTWEAVKFNQTFRVSDILSRVNSVVGVEYVTLSNLGASGGSSTADHTITVTNTTQVYLPVLRTISYSGVTGGLV
jgi:hypothetical protein|tara:strand:- start:1501 stop:2991 length:1491 start_codon:yes stop_codon:yes gene_type:complete